MFNCPQLNVQSLDALRRQTLAENTQEIENVKGDEGIFRYWRRKAPLR